jgi:inner membrane protein
MGMEPNYFFRFKLAEIRDGNVISVGPQQLGMQRNAKEGLNWVWQRIWNPQLSPLH